MVNQPVLPSRMQAAPGKRSASRRRASLGTSSRSSNAPRQESFAVATMGRGYRRVGLIRNGQFELAGQNTARLETLELENV